MHPRPSGRIAVLAATLVCGLLLTADRASAAGVHTHAAMAAEAIDHIEDRQLRRLLTEQFDVYRNGAFYPDSGYIAAGAGLADYGETSHWQRFIDASVTRIREDRLCRVTIQFANGPCARRIAHLLGAAAHGMGDETWDWLFEPSIKDRGESATGLGPGPIGTAEYAMDQVLLRERPGAAIRLPIFTPDVGYLVDAYGSYGRNDITGPMIRFGVSAQNAQSTFQQSVAPVEGLRVRLNMPRSSAAFYGAPGGVTWSGRAISGYLGAIWAKLRGLTPQFTVAATAPAHGERGLPTAWQPATLAPGPNGGGARTRIVAVFTQALAADTVTPDTVSLSRVGATGSTAVPLEPGTPYVGPYGESEGTHSLILTPASNLEACAVYRVDVSAGVRNRDGQGASPYAWKFATEGC